MKHITLRLTMEVSYSLNGETAETLKRQLEHVAQHAYGEGMLSGDTKAEVDSFHCTVDGTHCDAP